MKRGSAFKTLLITIGILGVGVGIAILFIKTKPKAHRVERPRQATVVEASKIVREDDRIIISGMGTVIAAQEVNVQAEVSGRVVEQSSNLQPGGFFEKDELILKIDPRDYRTAYKNALSNLEQARLNYKLENGRQEIAQREWELLEDQMNADDAQRELALRQPQLHQVEAALEAAQGAVDQARLNLNRTQLRAPFNAKVIMENVDIGQVVNSQLTVCKLVGTDQFWIQVSIPVSQLKWINLPNSNGEQGSAVKIIVDETGDEVITRHGDIIRLLPDLDEIGRMARILIAVDDPLNLGHNDEKYPLLLGSYVKVEIEGKMVEDVIVIPNSALRQNNKIWIMTPENTLEIKPVNIVWRRKESVIIRGGIDMGSWLITSKINTPVEGMELRLLGDDQKNNQSDPSREDRP